MKLFLVILNFVLAICIQQCVGHYDSVSGKLRRLGPDVVPTKGEPWPKPQITLTYGDQYMIFRPAIFRFKVTGNDCPLIEAALQRYYKIYVDAYKRLVVSAAQRQDSENNTNSLNWKLDGNFVGYLDEVEIFNLSPCETWPHDEMDESYVIKISTPDTKGKGMLIASNNWGIIRALETFTQLIHPTPGTNALKIRSQLIVDYPRFGFRSLLLDTSRHFLTKKVILENLDLMAINKLNVFHWHIVDDNSFPYQSKAFPGLSDKGAFHPYTHVYSQEDIREIIEFARLRGIRVIPEFDTPGHTQSWGPATPGLLTTCYDSKGKPDGKYGPIDPTNEQNYVFLEKLFKEIGETFPDQYIHLGGDEVDFGCWKSNPVIKEFMTTMNFTEYSQVEELYMQKLVKIVQDLPGYNSYLVWQEVFDNNVNIDPSTIVHVWKAENATAELGNVTAKGYRAVLSACWYLNYIQYGPDWPEYYKCDPQDFDGTDAQKRLVLGGGPAMWGEYVDSTNLISRTWPRASAPAERLWSARSVNSTDEAAPRLEEHRCRLVGRGYNAEPANGPSFCTFL